MPVLSHIAQAALCGAAALLLASPMASVAAREAIPPAAQSAAADPAVLAPIQALDQALIAVMKAGRSASFQSRADMLAPAMASALDLPYILRTSVGPSWSNLSADQHAALLAAFQRYTVASYVNNFDSYDGQRITVNPITRPLSSGQQVVSTQIIAVSGTTHKIDYVMRKTDAGWKAIDVLLDGSISRVAVQRSDFRSLLTRGGAPALEASLQQKTETLSRG